MFEILKNVHWYDLAKDFSGPILTAFSTSVALYLGLHTTKPKLDYVVYRVSDPEIYAPGLSNDNKRANTAIQFCLLSNSIGWFKLKSIDFNCGKTKERFYITNSIFDPNKGTDYIYGYSVSNIKEQIVLNSNLPTHTVYLNKYTVVFELSQSGCENINNDLVNRFDDIILIFNFETNDKKHKINITI